MSNYVTVDQRNQNPNTDLAHIMPMVADEVTQRRKRADAVAASMNVLEQQALADPEKFKNAKFNVSDNGLIGMNQSAKDLYAINPEFDMTQEGWSESSEELDKEGNDQLINLYTEDKDQKMNSDVAKAAADLAAGRTDLYKMNLAATQNYIEKQGVDLSNLATKPTTTTDNTKDTSAIATTENTKAPQWEGLETAPWESKTVPKTVPNPAGFGVLASSGNPAPENIPVVPKAETVTNDGKKTPLQETKEVVKELVKENPNKNIKAKTGEKNSKSESKGEGSKSSVTYDRSFEAANSQLDLKLGKKSTSSQRANIIDTDKASIPQLRRNAGLEAATNAFSLVNNNVETSKQMQNRLTQRQDFIDKHMASHGVIANTSTITPGTINYNNTGGKGGEKNIAGFSSYSNVSNSNAVSNDANTALTNNNPGPRDPNVGKLRGKIRGANGTLIDTIELDSDGKTVKNTTSTEGKFPLASAMIGNNTSMVRSTFDNFKNGKIYGNYRKVYVPALGNGVAINIPAHKKFNTANELSEYLKTDTSIEAILDPGAEISYNNRGYLNLGDSSRKVADNAKNNLETEEGTR